MRRPLRTLRRIARRGVLAASVMGGGCLLGADPLNGAPNVPTLDGEPRLLSPVPGNDGVARARSGTEVVLELDFVAPLDLASTALRLDDLALDCDASSSVATRYRCVGLFQGTEANGPKGLAGSATLPNGTSGVVNSAPLLIADFQAPSASCVLSPAIANGSQPVTLTVTPSEALQSPPTVTATPSSVAVESPTGSDPPYVFRVTGPPGQNVEGYVLRLTGTDRAGNPNEGTSLCDPSAATGSILGEAPQLAGTPTLRVVEGPRIEGAVPRVGEAAVLEVVLDTLGPLDRVATQVQLGDLALSFDVNTGTWRHTVSPGDLDGQKSLTAVLVDPAGNRTLVREPGLAVFVDLSAPEVASAALVRDPYLATASVDGRDVAFSALDPYTGVPVHAYLDVVSTEPLGAQPLLLVQGAGAPAFDPDSAEDRRVSWRCDDVGEGLDGAYTFDVVLEDELGNRSAPLPLDLTMRVDTEGPDEADLRPDAGLLHERALWGTATSAAPLHQVVGAASATAGGTLLSAEDRRGARLGTTIARADGSFTVPLGPDTAWVALRTHDEAGNPSPAVRVTSGRWTTSLVDKEIGDTRSNPLTLTEVRVANEGLYGPGDVSTEASLAEPLVSAVDIAWEPLPAVEDAAPEPRFGHAMAWDAARSVLVLFGGGSVASADTWQWDGTRWTRRSQIGAPPARTGHGMVYDARRDRVMLLAGVTDPATWAWDGAAWSKSAAEPSVPGTGISYASTYDSRRGVTVVFGGNLATGETWEWDGTAWTPRSPTGGPPGRIQASMAYDPERGVSVLFGGRTVDGVVLGDTWEWDGETWTESTLGFAPSPRFDHRMAYDPQGRRVLLFGGTNGTRSTGDTWGWTGAAWEALPVDQSPPPRDSHAMVSRMAEGDVLLFGGYQKAGPSGPFSTLADLWRWDGSGWRAIRPTSLPSPRAGASMVHDDVREEVLLAGSDEIGLTNPDFAYRWDDESWLPVPVEVSESYMGSSHLVFDDRGTTWLVASDVDNDTTMLWALEGSRFMLASRSAVPVGRWGFASGYHAGSGQVVLFGGSEGLGFFGDTWGWNGAGWTGLTGDDDPAPRDNAAMTYDRARDQLVLFGGFSGDDLDDTWTWDGTRWQAEAPSTSPSARNLASLVYDPVRDHSVLFGGDDNAETWLWDGASWREARAARSPLPRYKAAMTYFPGREGVLLFGGFRGAELFGDLWLLPSYSNARPRHQVDLPFAASGVSEASVRALTVRWRAGGNSWVGDNPTAGTELLVWDAGWQVVASNRGTSASPGELCWTVQTDPAAVVDPGCVTVVDPARVVRLAALGNTGSTVFAVRTTGVVGNDGATLRSDEIVMSVDYVLP